MTDKQKIRAEIERRMKTCEEAFNTCPSTAFGSRIDSYKALLSFIDSLPKEPVSEGIENELERFAYSLPHSADGFWPKDIDPKSVEARTKYGVHHYWSYEQVTNIARHFAEWQREQLMKELWHKGTDNPGNQHPYPVINPDTQEMAFAYYNQRLGWWEFDRDYNPGCNMLWLDIEKILPNLQEGGAQ